MTTLRPKPGFDWRRVTWGPALILDHVVDWWLRRCHHRDDWVLADLMEGEGQTEVKYCRRCGAVKRQFEKEFRRPRPLWHRP